MAAGTAKPAAVDASLTVTTTAGKESASFDKTGEQPKGVAQGTQSLYYGQGKVDQGHLQTQPGRFALTDEGLNVGP